MSKDDIALLQELEEEDTREWMTETQDRGVRIACKNDGKVTIFAIIQKSIISKARLISFLAVVKCGLNLILESPEHNINKHLEHRRYQQTQKTKTLSNIYSVSFWRLV